MRRTVPNEPATISGFTRWWRNWIGNRSTQAELHRMGPADWSGIAREIGASPSELRSLAGKWPDSAELLLRRMNTLQLEHPAVARALPAVARDLTRLCSLCEAKKQCRHDLDTHAVSLTWRRYCPNSSTLLALVEDRGGRSSSNGA